MSYVLLFVTLLIAVVGIVGEASKAKGGKKGKFSRVAKLTLALLLIGAIVNAWDIHRTKVASDAEKKASDEKARQDGEKITGLQTHLKAANGNLERANGQLSKIGKDFADYRSSAEQRLAGLSKDNENLQGLIAENQRKNEDKAEVTLKAVEDRIRGGAVVSRLLTKDHVAKYLSLIFSPKDAVIEEGSPDLDTLFPLVKIEGLGASEMFIEAWITQRLKQRVKITRSDLGLLVEVIGVSKYQLSPGGIIMALEPTKGASEHGSETIGDVSYAIDDKFRKSIWEKPHFWHDNIAHIFSFGINFLEDGSGDKRTTIAMSEALRALTKDTKIGSFQLSFGERPTPKQATQLEQLWRKNLGLYFKIYLSDRSFMKPQKPNDEGAEIQWNDMRPHLMVPVDFKRFAVRDKTINVDLIVSGEPRLFLQEEYPF